jgi:hypothetical protein
MEQALACCSSWSKTDLHTLTSNPKFVLDLRGAEKTGEAANLSK